MVKSGKLADGIGVASQAGLLVCFGAALWLEVIGDAEAGRIVRVCAFGCLATAGLNGGVNLALIGRNRRKIKNTRRGA